MNDQQTPMPLADGRTRPDERLVASGELSVGRPGLSAGQSAAARAACAWSTSSPGCSVIGAPRRA